MESILHCWAASAGNPPDAERATNALALFLALAILLGVFMISLVLIWAARRVRSTPRVRQDKTPLLDPWRESARRLQPYKPETPDNDDIDDGLPRDED